MTSFAISGLQTTTQTLVNGETGYVAPDGNLMVTTGDGIVGSGSIDVTVAGVINVPTHQAIDHDGTTIMLTVADGGLVQSGFSRAVDISVSNLANVVNYGTINALLEGIQVLRSDAAASISVKNFGNITSYSTAIEVDSGAHSSTLVNDGTISGYDNGIYADNAGQTGSVTLLNSGTLTSPLFAYTGGGGNDLLTNTGTIIGLISLGANSDHLNSLGGQIDGDIFGADGDDTITLNGTTFRGDIMGNSGADYFRINSAEFIGSVQGGTGNDTYVLFDEDIFIVEAAGEGTDLVISYASRALNNNFENLTLKGTRDIDGTGNDLDNVIAGNAGDNILRGGQGIDTISGGKGDDLLGGNAGNDILNGGNDNDILRGGLGADKLFGNDGDDLIRAGSGNDKLYGGNGDDDMRGGTGKDDFIFKDGTEGIGQDIIRDFNAKNNAEDISLKGVAEITDFTDLKTNHMSQVGKNVVIDAGDGNSITLIDVDINHLHAADFIF